jgi:hypothetical protein
MKSPQMTMTSNLGLRQPAAAFRQVACCAVLLESPRNALVPAGWLGESGSVLRHSKAGAMLRRATHWPNMFKNRKNFNLSAGHVA